ncbi:MAG TPA: PIN domain-containing protein [Rhizomicrobium sp.]|nr:PIN domain-containing protein [Rhizomicrobium sp.]
MAEQVTLDSNVLIYAFDPRDPDRQAAAQQLLWASQSAGALLTTKALGEFFWVLSRKGIALPSVARQKLSDLITLFKVVQYGTDVLEIAAIEVQAQRFSFWDAVLLAAAERAGCTICFSEDMADGATLGNITVRNPFGPKGLSAAAAAALAP